jgi:hypothetical protein
VAVLFGNKTGSAKNEKLEKWKVLKGTTATWWLIMMVYQEV